MIKERLVCKIISLGAEGNKASADACSCAILIAATSAILISCWLLVASIKSTNEVGIAIPNCVAISVAACNGEIDSCSTL